MTNTYTGSEHRRFTRVPFTTRVRLQAGDRAYEAELLDVSLKGALLQMPADWSAQPGHAAELELQLADGVTIRMQTNVAHIVNGRVGLACHHLDLDSATHLRRLIELNLGDESRLHRELSAMIASP